MKLAIGIIALVFSSTGYAEMMSEIGLKELEHYQPIHDCYKAFVAAPGQSGQKNGKVVIELNLDKLGNVVGATPNSNHSTIHEDILNSCLIKSLTALKYPKETSGKEKSISVIFQFPLTKNK